MYLWEVKKKIDKRTAYQKIIVPFLEPVVYPPERNKCEIEETIHIRDILWPWTFNKQINKGILENNWQLQIPSIKQYIVTHSLPKGSKNPRTREHQEDKSPTKQKANQVHNFCC
jgi:hypothetical protein